MFDFILGFSVCFTLGLMVVLLIAERRKRAWLDLAARCDWCARQAKVWCDSFKDVTVENVALKRTLRRIKRDHPYVS